MFSCEPVTWAEGVSAIASVLTLLAAAWGLNLWRSQLRGTTKHGVAIEAATAALDLSTAFFDARAPLYMAWEFPDEYNAMTPSNRTPHDEAKAWAHVYQNRWKPLHERLVAVARLRAKVGAVLSKEIADELEKLAHTAGKLNFWWGEDLDQRRAGRAVVRQWMDQEMVKATPDYVTVGPERDDKFSKEFHGVLDPLLEKLKEYI